jgi:membrane protein
VIGVVLMLALVVALPSMLQSASVLSARSSSAARWVLLAALLLFGLGVIFRYGPATARGGGQPAPSRRRRRLAVSIGFSIYVSLMGNYNKTYGSLGAIIVLLLWLYFMAYAVLFGAAMNAELERQTERDTTAGADKPMGERGAHVADTVGPTRKEL